jgi:hypothetical protein
MLDRNVYRGCWTGMLAGDVDRGCGPGCCACLGVVYGVDSIAVISISGIAVHLNECTICFKRGRMLLYIIDYKIAYLSS